MYLSTHPLSSIFGYLIRHLLYQSQRFENVHFMNIRTASPQYCNNITNCGLFEITFVNRIARLCYGYFINRKQLSGSKNGQSVVCSFVLTSAYILHHPWKVENHGCGCKNAQFITVVRFVNKFSHLHISHPLGKLSHSICEVHTHSY